MTLHITSPIDSETIEKLRAGDQVLISGVIYVGRDSAHKRLVETRPNRGMLSVPPGLLQAVEWTPIHRVCCLKD